MNDFKQKAEVTAFLQNFSTFLTAHTLSDALTDTRDWKTGKKT